MNLLNAIVLGYRADQGTTLALRFFPALGAGYHLANTIFTDYRLSDRECCNTLTGQLKEDVEALREQIPAAKKIHFVTAEKKTIFPMVTRGRTLVVVSNEDQHKSFHNKFTLAHEISHALSSDNYTLNFCRFAVNTALACVSMPVKRRIAGLALGTVFNTYLLYRMEKKADFFAAEHIENKELAKAVRTFDGEWYEGRSCK